MVKPLLYGPDNRPMKPYGGFFRRDAAKRTGSMANWRPQQTFGDSTESMERETIISRAMNLVNDDPNAEGIIGGFATTIIGAGLRPIPELNADALGISKEEARAIEAQQKQVYKDWARNADAGERMTDGEIQHLKCRCLFGFGESFEIIHMRKDGPGAYSQVSQIINPLRVKTPTDKQNDENIKSGIRIGKFGQPISYFIKKAGGTLSDVSTSFIELPARNGHRWKVLHDFIAKDPEQMRGYPILSPAIRFFRDLSDLLGAELTSNVVTAAMSIFVGSTGGGYQTAENLLDAQADRTDGERYQSVNPGEIWYGEPGEKPELLSANRPGTTFDPFTKLIKKSISMATGVPYPVLFKDVDGVNFAGFRAAMLEAWRVYDYHRKRIGRGDCQKKYTMLMEEAWLRGTLDIGDDFMEKRDAYTNAEWYGAPKGDIEPYKAIMADMLKNKANVKSLERIIIEDGGAGFGEITDQIAEERGQLALKKLPTGMEPEQDQEDDDRTMDD